jgi:hypothetical protein
MKLSKATVAILENFASVNSNLLIKAGSKLSTISPMKSVAASVSVEETFDVDFGIYDLNQFLGTLGLFQDPEVKFAEKYVEIREGSNKVRFYSADESVLNYPKKDINFPAVDVEFEMTEEVLNRIKKASGVLRSSDIRIVGDGSNISIVVGDTSSNTSNTYTIAVGDTDKTFDIQMKVENLKMIPGSYTASFSSRKISRFASSVNDLVYYIAVEASSTFG